jgi:hypothetical protein
MRAVWRVILLLTVAFNVGIETALFFHVGRDPFHRSFRFQTSLGIYVELALWERACDSKCMPVLRDIDSDRDILGQFSPRAIPNRYADDGFAGK